MTATVDLLNAHFDAFRALLDDGVIAGRVDDVVRLTTTGEAVQDNYVVVTVDLPTLDDDRYLVLEDADSTGRYRFDVRSVAVDRAGVLLFAQTVRQNVLRRVVDVPGRVCDPVRLVGPVEEGRVRWDRTARLFYVDETFEVVSRRVS